MVLLSSLFCSAQQIPWYCRLWGEDHAKGSSKSRNCGGWRVYERLTRQAGSGVGSWRSQCTSWTRLFHNYNNYTNYILSFKVNTGTLYKVLVLFIFIYGRCEDHSREVKGGIPCSSGAGRRGFDPRQLRRTTRAFFPPNRSTFVLQSVLADP